MANATKAAEFLEIFKSEAEALSASMVTLSMNLTITSQALQPLSIRLNQLSASLNDAQGFLSPFDKRTCAEQVSSLETKVDQLRTKIPKSKFSFKRQAASSQSTPSTSTTPTPVASTLAATPISNLTSSAYLTLKDVQGAESQTDISLSQLNNCVVNLIPHPLTALYAKNLVHCVVIVDKVEGSARFEDCSGCQIVLACRQFRMERCADTDVHLNVKSLPVIEECKDIRFSGYPLNLPNSGTLAAAESQHFDVKDFSWIQSTPSPNWSKTPEAPSVDLSAVQRFGEAQRADGWEGATNYAEFVKKMFS